MTRIVCAALCVFIAACGKLSESPQIDQELAQRLYLACVSQPAASPYACRANAEELAIKRTKQ